MSCRTALSLDPRMLIKLPIHDTVYEKHGGRGSGSGSEEMILREDKSNTGIMRTTEISVQR